MSLEDFKKSIKKSKIIKKGEYEYFIHPITDGIPEIKPKMLQEITSVMIKNITRFGSIDKIVTIESMGIPLATAISLQMNIPFAIIRKRKYGLPGEIKIDQVTGYSKSKLYLNGFMKGENVVIVDDVISTGGTLKSVIFGLKELDVNIKGVIVAVNKGVCLKKFEEKFGISVTSIINVDAFNNLVFEN